MKKLERLKALSQHLLSSVKKKSNFQKPIRRPILDCRASSGKKERGKSQQAEPVEKKGSKAEKPEPATKEYAILHKLS